MTKAKGDVMLPFSRESSHYLVITVGGSCSSDIKATKVGIADEKATASAFELNRWLWKTVPTGTQHLERRERRGVPVHRVHRLLCIKGSQGDKACEPGIQLVEPWARNRVMPRKRASAVGQFHSRQVKRRKMSTAAERRARPATSTRLLILAL